MDGNYELYPSNPIEAQLFEKGCEYAIKRAVKYLEANFPDIENVGSQYKENFINSFCKAMER
jgi:hypothetical protein